MTATAPKMGSSSRAAMPSEREIDTKTFSGRVAARLRTLRKAKGWNVPELTKAINSRLEADDEVAQSTVHGWDNGNRKIDPDYYPMLARLFGLSVAEFLPKK